MEYLWLSFIAGILTLLSPCVLPVLPVIIGGSVTGKHKSRPYIIIGALVVSIIVFTLLLKASTVLIDVDPAVWTTISGGIIIIFGIVTLFPGLWEWATTKVNLTGKTDSLLHKSAKKQNRIGSVLVGLSLGPVFSSCSPTYAIIIATVLPQNYYVGLLNLSLYALGLGGGLLLVSVFGQRLIKKLRWAADPRGWFKKVLGVLFIIVGLAIITGLEKDAEAWLLEKGYINATNLEVDLLDNSKSNNSSSSNGTSDAVEIIDTEYGKIQLAVDEPYPAPEISDIEAWINSDGETIEDLEGKVVVIDFWTYSCINCIRTLPFLRDWYEKYEDDGLVILGIHAPEFQFEQVPANVQKAVDKYEIKYPVALDNNFTTWRAYQNRFWPAKYFIDRQGNVRHTHFGEGEYAESEAIIRYLLAEDGVAPSDDMGDVSDDVSQVSRAQSPETYLGYSRADSFINIEEFIPDEEVTYTLSEELSLNQWSLGGDWIINEEGSVAVADGAQLAMQFSARDVYLVITADEPSTAKIELFDGEELVTREFGVDVTNETGEIVVDQADLYHLVDSEAFLDDYQLRITADAGVQVHAFTFGS